MSYVTEMVYIDNLSRIAREPVLGTSDQTRHKPGYITTDIGYR